MGKKRITTEASGATEGAVKSSGKAPRKRHVSGILHIQSTYNNTKVLLSDDRGNALAWSSSGSLGFKGAKKGTPFAASRVGEIVAERAAAVGIKEVSVAINGVGAGRESALRSFVAKGIGVTSISDITPVPHNGPRRAKPRRV